jgi:2,5-diamino-6-(ribosylamino)-4(3H)-pyrimidinone 5'-phosphate reductase
MSPKSKAQSPKLPFVLVNMAMTADGKIATANRAVHSFSSRRDLEHLYELRATADAVMCGARTVEISRSVLGTGGEKFRRLRLKRGLAEYNLRVIASGSGSINPEAGIFKKRFSPIIILTTQKTPEKDLHRLRALANEVKVFGVEKIDFRKALLWLRVKRGVKRLVCEGGGELNDALFREGLVDELHLTICSKIIGGRHAPTVADGEGVSRLTQAMALKIKSFRRVGDEVFAVFKRAATSE